MILTGTLLIILQLVAGFLMLLFGGDWLVDSGVAIARRFKISPLVIGLTIVAFGTSAPELLVSTISAIQGNSGIAMGNVVGSNIANIGLILGLTAMICPIAVTGMKEILANGLVMIGASILLPVLSANGIITHLEGILLFLLIIVYTVISIRRGRSADNTIPESDAPQSPSRLDRPVAAFLLLILSCAMLSLGADLLVKGASSLASALGVSDKVIGLTVVAFGTSLPELAASVAAALKKQMDISIGNIIGSNIFNILCVLGVSSAISPITIQFDSYLKDFVIMLAFAFALVLAVRPWKKTGKLSRMSGLILFLAYATYVATL